MMLRFVLLLVLVFAVPSCAVFDGKSRKLNIEDGSGVSFDITRRAVLAAHYPVKNPDGTPNGEMKAVRVCAEPSPDAMTTIAAELAASAETPNGVSAQLAANLRENGAFVGLRTQSIQLLRDGMYRSCEAYLSGGITEDEYSLLLRRHQRYMLALLSIEALTGTVRVPAVTISTESLASAARSLSAIREEIDKIEAREKELATEKTALTTERDASGTSEERKTDISERLLEIESAQTQLAKDKETLNEGIKNASGLMVSGVTSVEVSNIGIAAARSDSHVEKIAETVAEITNNLIELDDLGSICLNHLKNAPKPNDSNANGTFEDAEFDSVFTSVCYKRISELSDDYRLRR